MTDPTTKPEETLEPSVPHAPLRRWSPVSAKEGREARAFVGRLLETPWLSLALLSLLLWCWAVQLALGWPFAWLLPREDSLAQALRTKVLGAQLGWVDGPMLLRGEWWRLLSPSLLHASLLHLAGNCLGLFLLGRFVENVFGRAALLFGYAASAAVGVVLSASIAADRHSLGASGAVLGLLGMTTAFGLRHRARIPRPLRDLFRLDMWFFVGFTALLSTLSFVDWAGHLGGFLAGTGIGWLWPAALVEGEPARGRRLFGTALGAAGAGSLLATLLVLAARVTEVPELLPDSDLRALQIAVVDQDREEIRRITARLAARFPDQPDLALEAALAAEDWGEAAILMKRILDSAPQARAPDPMFDNNLAWSLFMARGGDREAVAEGLQRVRRALKSDPDDPVMRNTLAYGLLLDGQAERAERVIAEVMAGRPRAETKDDAFIHVMALLALGRAEEALREYRDFAAEFPDGVLRAEAEHALREAGMIP